MSLSRQTRVSLTLLIAAFFLLSTNYFAFDETYYFYPNPSLYTKAGWTQPRESNPAFKSPLAQFWLASVHFADSQNGWAVGFGGKILHTSNAGASWQYQSSPSRLALNSAHFADSQNGWAVGGSVFEGITTILHTSNGGASWQSQSSPSRLPLISVHFTDAQNGWAVGAGPDGRGTILHTSNAGASWQSQSSPSSELLFSVHFTDSQNGWAVGGNFIKPIGTILHTSNAGASWQSQSSPSNQSLKSVHFTDTQNGWAVGRNGTILHTSNAGASWESQSSPSSDSLTSVHFADAQNGWAVGDDGTILHTSNAGASWQSKSFPSRQDFTSVHFADAQNGWAVGYGGTILHTTNAGTTWQETKLNTRYPAPIYWPISLFCLLSLLLVLRPNQPRRLSAIDAIATTDSPVSSPNQDLLGRAGLAKRLFRFLSNTNTKPPFCLSIEAPWGHGKSSIMGMLQNLLTTQKTAATVWFNAWHHRKEDSLLAFLLEAIKKQSVPRRLAWFPFAAKLLLRRAKSPISLLFLLAIGFAIYFNDKLPKLPPSLDDYKDWLAYLAAVAALYPAYQILLKSFRIDPEKLLTATKDSLRLSDLRGKTDVRAGFIEELRTVIKCLPSQRLVIFLDDLDRCPPDHIVEMLEAVNFLSGASNCIFVLGIDRDYVETAVGLHYEKIAAARSPKLDPATARRAFAKSYLEKIINITVGLPDLQASDVSKMLSLPAQPKQGPISLRRTITAALLTMALIFSGAAFYYSRQAPQEPPKPQIQETQAPDLGPQPEKKTTKPDPAPKTEKTPQANNQANQQPTAPPPPSVKWLVLSSATFGFLAVLFVVLFSTRKDQISDTKAFSEALDLHKQEIWTRASASPREVRRILNNIRLIAAGLPIPPPEPPTYPRWAAFIERLHRRLVNDTPPPADQPFSPVPGDIPALVLNYPASTSPQLTEWYEKECRSLGFPSPDHFIRNRSVPSAPPPAHFDFS